MPPRKRPKVADPNRTAIAQAEAAQRPVGREQVALGQEEYDTTVRLVQRGLGRASEVWREALRTGLRGMDAASAPDASVDDGATPLSVGLPDLPLFAPAPPEGGEGGETVQLGADGQVMRPSEVRRATEDDEETAA